MKISKMLKTIKMLKFFKLYSEDAKVRIEGVKIHRRSDLVFKCKDTPSNILQDFSSKISSIMASQVVIL